MSNIKSLKLVTGEELVAEVVSELSDTTIELKNIVAAALQRNPQTNEVGIGFMPWMHSTKTSSFVVGRDKIVCIVEVADDVRNGYNQIFGSGILVPPKQLITG